MYIRTLHRVHWDIAPITDNQMETKMEHETETGFTGVVYYIKGLRIAGRSEYQCISEMCLRYPQSMCTIIVQRIWNHDIDS